ncbi:MAG: hypothetical protein ACYDCC_09665 [Actinomycetota bacterium]
MTIESRVGELIVEGTEINEPDDQVTFTSSKKTPSNATPVVLAVIITLVIVIFLIYLWDSMQSKRAEGQSPWSL